MKKMEKKTYFYCLNQINSSLFGIYSFDNPILEEYTGLRMEAFDYNADNKIDSIELAKELYKNLIETKSIKFNKADSSNYEELFEVVNRIYEEVNIYVKDSSPPLEGIYEKYRKDIESLWIRIN
jgi:hypothetical protein